MLSKEQIKEFAKKQSERMKNMSDEELKKEFIASFGEEKWIEEEMLGRLMPLSFEVSDYLGIDYFPILFEELPEDSRIYFEEEYIAINVKFKDDYYECAKCVAHELRHIYQLVYVKVSSDKRALRMKEELEHPVILDPNDITSITNYSFQEIEIDAYAFTKWYLKKYLNMDVIHPSRDYEKIITAYMQTYFK